MPASQTMPGVGAMSIVYRRESGAVDNHTIELDEHVHGRCVVTCYGAIPS